MAKMKDLTEVDKVANAAFSGLLSQLMRSPETTRRVSSGLYVFRVGEEYAFRVFPGLRHPIYVDHIVFLSEPHIVEMSEQRQAIDLGPIDVAPIGGTLFNSAREAATALVPLAVGMYRAQLLSNKLNEGAAGEAPQPPEAAVPTTFGPDLDVVEEGVSLEQPEG